MQLVVLLRKYPSQVRADVQRFYGLCLDDVGEAFSIRHLADLVLNLPRESATVRAVAPETVWGPQEHLLAEVADTLRWIAWSKSSDGAKNRNKPKPIPRPGQADKSAGRFKDAAVLPVDEVKRLLRLPRR